MQSMLLSAIEKAGGVFDAHHNFYPSMLVEGQILNRIPGNRRIRMINRRLSGVSNLVVKMSISLTFPKISNVN